MEVPEDSKAVIFVIRKVSGEATAASRSEVAATLRECLEKTRAKLVARGLTVREVTEPGSLSLRFVLADGRPTAQVNLLPVFAGVIFRASGKRVSLHEGPETEEEFLPRVESYFSLTGLAP